MRFKDSLGQATISTRYEVDILQVIVLYRV